MVRKNERLTKSIAKKLGKEGIEYLEKNGDLPAIKLSNEEMNYIKGGGPDWLDNFIKDVKDMLDIIKNKLPL